jgi:hypothetical protein
MSRNIQIREPGNNYADVLHPETNSGMVLMSNGKTLQNDLDTHKADYATHTAKNASLSSKGHVNHAVLTATLDTTWSGTSAPYTKTVSVSGILSTDTPIIDVVMSGTYSTDEARIEAWGYIYRAVTADGSITFYATDKPTVSIPVQIRVVR